MRSSWLTVDPKSNDQGPYKRLKSRKQPQRQRGSHVQTEVETPLQAKGTRQCQELAQPGERQETDSPSEPAKGPNSEDTLILDSRPSELRE